MPKTTTIKLTVAQARALQCAAGYGRKQYIGRDDSARKVLDRAVAALNDAAAD